jgi:diguanylate cyclase (GGDEF)-like protein
MILSAWSILRHRVLGIEPAFVIERLFFDITDMVVLTDIAGVIRKSNHSLSNQTNLFPGTLVGKHLSEILPDVELQGQVVYRAPQKRIFETNLRLPAGDLIPVRGSLSVVADVHDDPVGYYFLLHDLREMRKVSEYAVELQQANRKLETLSKMDSLTGIWNRAKFDEVLQYELDRFKRYGLEFAVILFDIDKFKTINDALGHLGGDEVLKAVVGKVKAEIRSTDTFARWGGDEFAILLPCQDMHGGMLVAERILKAVASIDRQGMTISASIGLTVADRGDDLAGLIGRADEAMYGAKEDGGNYYVVNCVQHVKLGHART